jgi:hypothetical protein
MRAYRYVRLAKRDSSAFQDNLYAAYTALESRRGVLAQFTMYSFGLPLLTKYFPF